ncbi:MAG: carboxymuconolactone decarboxylase family protein [Planctomycetota bacterium]
MNPRLQPLDGELVPAASRPILESVQRAIGKVPNLHRTLANSPAALRAYTDMAQALSRGDLPVRLREQIAVAAAGMNGCAYCASAHTAIGQGVGLDRSELERNLSAESSDSKTTAVLAFVRELIERRGDVDESSLRAVREAGFEDRHLAEIVAHVAMNVFTNTFNVFARTPIDFPLVELEATR